MEKKTITFTEAVKDRFVYDEEENVWLDKYASEFGMEPRINVTEIIEDICEMGETAIREKSRMKLSQIALCISGIGFINFIFLHLGINFTGNYFMGNIMGGLFLYFVGLIIESKQDAKSVEGEYGN